MYEFVLILMLGSSFEPDMEILQKPFSSHTACVEVGDRWILLNEDLRGYTCLKVKKPAGAYK